MAPDLTPPRDDRTVLGLDEFEIDLAALELRRDGVPVSLAPQAVRLLGVLARHRGDMVTRQQLYVALWPEDPTVDVDRGLNTLIRQIRNALGDDAASPRYIRTYPRRGYRLLSAPLPQPTADAEAFVEGHVYWRPWGVVTAAVVGFAALGIFLFRSHDPDASIPEGARESFALGRQMLESPLASRRAGAVPYFEHVVRLGPNSSRARAFLADAMLWANRREGAVREARRALELDRREPHALFISGVLTLIREWDWTRAEQLLAQAVARDEGSVTYRVVLAFALTTAGRREESVRLLDQSRAMDPASAILASDIGMMYLYADRPREAAEACEHAIRMAPEATYAIDCALAARVALGHADSARVLALRLIDLAGGNRARVLGNEAPPADSVLVRYRRWQAEQAALYPSRAPFDAAIALAQAGQLRKAVEALKVAAANRDMGFITATVDPRLAVLHRDPSFVRLTAPLVAAGAAPPRS